MGCFLQLLVVQGIHTPPQGQPHFLCSTLIDNVYGSYLFVFSRNDQSYGRGGTPVFTGVFEPVARVTLYLTDENGLGTCFGAA